MSRMNDGAGVYLKHFLVLIFLCVFLLLFDVTECWKLRDSTQKGEGLNVTISRHIKTVHSTIPLSATVKLDVKKIKLPVNVVRKKVDVVVEDDDDDQDVTVDDEDGDNNDDDDNNYKNIDNAPDDNQMNSEESEENGVNGKKLGQNDGDENDGDENNGDENDDDAEDDNDDDGSSAKNDIHDLDDDSNKNNGNEDEKLEIDVPAKKYVIPIKASLKKRIETSKSDVDDSNFVFERVNRAKVDLPKIKPKPEKKATIENLENDKNDDADEVGEDEEINTKQSKSKELQENENGEESLPFYQPILSLFDEAFVKKPIVNENGEIESKGFFEWLSFYRNQETHAEREADDTKPSANVEPSFGWRTFFDRKPFNNILNYFWSDEQSNELQVIEREDDHGENDHIETNRSTLSSEHFERLLLNIPSFVPNYTKISNPNCKRLGEIFLRQVRGQKLWAIQMWDATAKIPSGLLRGNTNQFGDFDLCTEIRTKVKLKDEKSVKVKGKYCMANIDVRASDEELKLVVHLMQGRNLLRSRLEDPGHFLPRFSTLKWGVCVPHGCTPDDAKSVLNDLLTPYNITGIKLFVDVDEHDCTVKNTKRWEDLIANNQYIIGTITLFAVCVFLVLLTTINDCWKELKLDVLFAPDEFERNQGKQKSEDVMEVNDNDTSISTNLASQTDSEQLSAVLEIPDEATESTFKQVYMAFSIKRTTNKLFNSSDASDHLEFIDGLKGTATILLFLCCKFLVIGHQAFSNRAHLTELLSSPPSILVRIILLYMNTFLTISGFLLALNCSKEFDRINRSAWIKRYIARYLRLVFPLLAILLFNTWLFEHIDNGPQWGTLIKQNADLCKANIWKNLLFISNWFPAQAQCALHFSEFAVTFQLFLIMPAFIWSFNRNEDISIAIFSILIGFSTALNFSDTISQRLSPVIFHGMKLTQIYRTINLSFLSPIHRATPYLIGAGVGAIMYKAKRDVTLPMSTYWISWSSAVFFMAWCIYTPVHSVYKDYIYEPNDMANYAAWAPMLWSLGLCWIIYSCFIEKSEFLVHFLTLKPFVVLGKISYEFYLVQLPVLFYFAATSRSNESFNIWAAINFLELGVCLSVAFLLAIIIGFPFQTISQILIKSSIKDCFDGQNAITNGETVAESKEEDFNVVQNVDESTLTPSRRVSWGNKTYDANDSSAIRPTTPVWKKDEAENNHSFWADEDDDSPQTDLMDRPELEAEEPIEISFSDLEDERDRLSSDAEEEEEEEDKN